MSVNFASGSFAFVAQKILAGTCSRNYLAFAWPRADWGPAGLFPLTEGGVPEHSMRSVLPPSVEERGVHCGGFLGGDQVVPIGCMRVGFIGCHEACSEHGGLGPEREGSDEAAPIRDASGRDHGNWSDSIGDARHQRQSGDSTPDMPACFPTLRDNDIYASVDAALRFFRTAHGVQDSPARLMHARNPWGWIAPEKRIDPDALAEADLQFARGPQSRTKFTPKGRRVRACVWRSRKRVSSSVRHVSESKPRPPALQTAATSSGFEMPPIGACTTGTSNPSCLHSCV